MYIKPYWRQQRFTLTVTDLKSAVNVVVAVFTCRRRHRRDHNDRTSTTCDQILQLDLVALLCLNCHWRTAETQHKCSPQALRWQTIMFPDSGLTAPHGYNYIASRMVMQSGNLTLIGSTAFNQLFIFVSFRTARFSNWQDRLQIAVPL